MVCGVDCQQHEREHVFDFESLIAEAAVIVVQH